jgi:hypothetical protein
MQIYDEIFVDKIKWEILIVSDSYLHNWVV